MPIDAMKRGFAILVVVALAGLVLAPGSARADGRFWGGFVAGGLTGLILGGALAAPPYVGYPYPGPPAYAAPAPGYAPLPGYGLVWVPPGWAWNGYQWVWQSGYWRYY